MFTDSVFLSCSAVTAQIEYPCIRRTNEANEGFNITCVICTTLEPAFYFVKVIKNPVTDHLPAGCLKIGTSYHSDQLVDVRKFAEDKPVVFVVGAMAHGKVLSRQIVIFSSDCVFL